MSPGAAGAPGSGANNAGGNQAFCSTCQSSDGLPRWWIDSPWENLWISDVPLSYTMSSGQQMNFRFIYRQRYKVPEIDEVPNLYPKDRRDQEANPYFNYMRTFGMTNASWSHSWMMNILFWDRAWELHSTGPVFSQGYEALVFRPEGGVQYFYNPTPTLAPTPPDGISQVSLQALSGLGYPVAQSPSSDTNNIYWGDPGVGFKLVYPDGSQDVFGICYRMDSNQVDTNSTAFALLTQRIDPAGRTNWLGYEKAWMTNCIYHSVAFRIRYVVDPDGRTNTFRYDTNACNVWQLTEIDDPYGRKATFSYGGGLLGSIVDAASNTNSFTYQSDTSGWISTVTTLYGTTSFNFYQYPDTNQVDGFFERATYVQEPEGAQQLFYFANQYSGLSTNAAAPSVPGISDFDNGSTGSSSYTLDYRNTLHWDRHQFTALTSAVTNFLQNGYYGIRLSNAVSVLSTNDLKIASLQHWLLGGDGVSVTESLSSERDPSPDSSGQTEGARVWYDYADKPSQEVESTDAPQVTCVARLLPDNSSQYGRYRYYSGVAPLAGLVWTNYSSYSLSNGSVGELATWFQYAANGTDLTVVSNSMGQRVMLGYNGNHQVTSVADPLNQTNTLSWDGLTHNLTGLTLSSGQSVGFSLFGFSSTNKGLVSAISSQPQGRVIGITNYTAGLPKVVHATGTGLPDLWLTNSWDGLNRLVNTAFTDDSTSSNFFTGVHLAGRKNRLGNWTWLGYDGLEHLISVTDARSNITQLSWCSCGALQSLIDPLSNPTTFYYNNQELLTGIGFADGSSVTNFFDSIGRMIQTRDGAGRLISYGYNNQGLVTTVSNAFGQVLQISWDASSRPTTVIDVNGVSVTNQFDLLNRVTSRTSQDGFGEGFGYATNGLVAYTNRDGKITRMARDNAGRLIGLTNANNEVIAFTNNALDEMTDLWDGRTNHTTWHFNQYGWLTNKVDALGREVFRYTRDPNGQITNRWTPQFSNTVYGFDPVGNLTNITYFGSSAPAVTMVFDALNRLQTMVDGAGTSTFNYTAAGQLQTEDGPWANDTITNSYIQQLRQTLSLAQPSGGAWSQTYSNDLTGRFQSLSSPAGAFNYAYLSGISPLVQTIGLPNGASISNHFDSLFRMDGTSLINHWGHILDGYGYVHDPLGLRTNITRNLGMTTNFVSVSYDNIGQITSWSATESNGAPRLNEQWAWVYDKAGNLQIRTSGALVQTFTADPANELTNISRTGNLTVSGATPAPATNVTVNGQTAVTYGDLTFAATNLSLLNGPNSFTNIARNKYGTIVTNIVAVTLSNNIGFRFDLNGNVTNDSTRTFVFDAENRVVTNSVAGAWKSEFVYDGLGRRRIERDYGWQQGTSSWGNPTNELHFIYDGLLLIQVRNGNNTVLVTYTRGLDLSGSIAGAGGIGGLLARTDGNGSTFYHGDGSGNITALIDNYQVVQARYEYNAFGKLVQMSGALGPVNEMQFSSMPVHRLSGMPHFLGREYGVDWDGWLQRDPIGEAGGINLYQYVGNNPIDYVDPYGLLGWRDFNPGLLFSGTAWKGLPGWFVNDVLIGDTGGSAFDRSSKAAQDQAGGLGLTPIYDANGNIQSPGDAALEVVMTVPGGFVQAGMMMLGPGEAEGAYAAADKALQTAAKASKCWIKAKDFAKDLRGKALDYFRRAGRNVETGQHGDVYKKAGNYLIQYANENKNTLLPEIVNDLKTEGNRLIEYGNSISHK
jgi:RHS repeat-associated protein